MTAFSCVDELYQSLIDASQKEKNEEMEESILETLFRDQKYDLVLYALEKGFTLTPQIIEQIKVSGDLKLYQYLFQHQKLKINFELRCLVAESGKLETVKWLRENASVLDEYTCAFAAKGGHLDILKWARENGCPWYKNDCLRLTKQPEIVEWINAN